MTVGEESTVSLIQGWNLENKLCGFSSGKRSVCKAEGPVYAKACGQERTCPWLPMCHLLKEKCNKLETFKKTYSQKIVSGNTLYVFLFKYLKVG